MTDDRNARYRDNLQGEVDGASLYRALAEVEPDAKLAEVYRRLAAVEESHAEYWKKQLRKAGARVPNLRSGFRTRGRRSCSSPSARSFR